MTLALGTEKEGRKSMKSKETDRKFADPAVVIVRE